MQKIFSGVGSKFPEKFNMAKINNLAIPGGGWGPDPMSPPLWIRPAWGEIEESGVFTYKSKIDGFNGCII